MILPDANAQLTEISNGVFYKGVFYPYYQKLLPASIGGTDYYPKHNCRWYIRSAFLVVRNTAGEACSSLQAYVKVNGENRFVGLLFAIPNVANANSLFCEARCLADIDAPIKCEIDSAAASAAFVIICAEIYDP